MSFKSLFIKETIKTENVVTPDPIIPVSIPSPQTSPSIGNGTNKADEGIVNNFWNEILRGNLPGPDYLELRSVASGLKKRIPGEKEQFETAFDVIKMSNPGFNKKIITDSMDEYLKILEREKQNALSQLSLKKEEKVGSKQKEIEEYKKKCSEITERIEELKKTLLDYNNHIGNLEREVLEGTNDLRNQEEIFNLSVLEVKNSLLHDRSIIDSSQDIQ